MRILNPLEGLLEEKKQDEEREEKGNEEGGREGGGGSGEDPLPGWWWRTSLVSSPGRRNEMDTWNHFHKGTDPYITEGSAFLS